MEWCPLGRLYSFRQNWGNLESVIRTLKLFILGIFLQVPHLFRFKGLLAWNNWFNLWCIY
ncbi:hypothetical protein MTR67_045028 [Solanum verrucosum]|uniref:Uncharacterized protein n=1 Tax=Solanum verrucosum TaxID=315347 RepID=A0AAF0UUL1_SOLVR|nr:hypothetical protein MTR67_045028 [Solanum verrucosum]